MNLQWEGVKKMFNPVECKKTNNQNAIIPNILNSEFNIQAEEESISILLSS